MVHRKVLLALIFVAGVLWADTGFKDLIRVTETDNSPSCMAGQIKFANGNVSCSGNVATVSDQNTGGSGGASALEVFVGAARSSPTASITANTAQFSGSVSGSTFTFTLRSSSVTLLGQSPPASSIAAGSLGSGVIASSLSVNSVSGSNIVNATITGSDVDTSSFTLLGPSIDASELPADGYASTYVNVSGDTMTGQLTVTSVTVTGAGTRSSFLTVTGTATIAGQSVCLEDGTDCPASGAGGVSVYPATATASFPFGFTVSTITVTGGGAGEIDLTEGTQPSGISGSAVLWADSGDHWLKFIPNGTTDYLVVGTSTTITARSLPQFDSAGSIRNASAALLNGTETNPGLLMTQTGAAPAIKIWQQANTGTTAGTSGAFVLDNTSNTGRGMQLYTAGLGPPEALLWVVADNPGVGGMDMVVIESSATNPTELRLQSPQPNLEFFETDNAAGPGRWSFLLENGLFNLYGRNAAGSAVIKQVEIDRAASTNGMYMALLTTGTLRLNDVDNSAYVGLKASTTVSASISFTLPAADGSSGQVLHTNGAGALYFDNDDTSAGGGGASTLEVFIGAARSSPTASITANTSQFTGSVSGSTFTFTLNSSSVTLQGNVLGGDVTGTLGTSIVGDDSHAHTGATLSGIDVSDDINLTASGNAVLSGDNVGVPDIVIGTGTAFGNIFDVSATSVSANGFVSMTSTGSTSALRIIANGVYGTTAGTSGGLAIDCTGGAEASGYCSQFYTNAGAQGALGGIVNVIADNTAWNEPAIYIKNDGTSGAAAGIRMDQTTPQIEFVESDQASPAGKFELGVNGDLIYWAGRNGADNSFEVFFRGSRYGLQNYVGILSSGAFRWYDADSSNFVGFSAPDTVASDVLWKLPSSDAAGVMTSDGSGNLSFSAAGTGNAVLGSSQTWAGRNLYQSTAPIVLNAYSADSVVVTDAHKNVRTGTLAGNITLGSNVLGVPLTSLSTGTVGTLDISAQTNLAASGQANLSNDTINVGPTSLSTGTIGTLDISAQTNLTATGNANLNGDAVNVGPIKIGSGTLGAFDVTTTSASATGADGLRVRYNITAGSGTFSDVLTIPNGTGPTVDATGECAMDTTDATIVCYDGSSAHVVAHSTHSFTVTISSEGWNGHSLVVWRAPHDMAVTINKIMAESLTASTTVMFQLDETTFGGTGSAGTDVFSVQFSSAHNQGVTTTSFSNAGIAAQSSLVFNTPAAGAAGGSPKGVTFTVYYTKDRE